MSKTITSNTIVMMDTTDDRKLSVYISSNHPSTQLYNSNTKAYTPDWSTTNLRLDAEIYLDAQDVTTNSQTDIGWYTKIGNKETLIGSGSSIIVSTNALAANPIITYICKARYQGIDALSMLTFTRSDTGVDGTSLTILGTYESIDVLKSAHPIGNAGDSYIIDGDLYVWAVDNSEWENVGRIQGPAGKDAKNIVLSGSAQVFKVDKTNTYFPPVITVEAQALNTNITAWSYSVDGGITFNAPINVNGVTRSGNIVTVDGATLPSNSLVMKASDGEIEDVFTIYKAFDGMDGTPGSPGSPVPFAFLTNENISFGANSSGQVPMTTFTTNVVAYIGTEKTQPKIGEVIGLPTGMTMADPVSVLDEVVLTFTISDNSDLGSIKNINGDITIPITSPVNTNLKLTWSKINAGADGAIGTPGNDAVTFQVYSNNGYALSANTPTVTLQTFAYIGDIEITAGAEYQWYVYDNNSWSAISGATLSYMDVSRQDVSFSKSYMCKMKFNGIEYTSVATIDDKNDANKVFTVKPSNYTAGDLWIVGADYRPGAIEVGTLLRAEHTNTSYADNDWITATKYDDKIEELKDKIDTYNEHFSFDSTNGITMTARDSNGVLSKFSTSLTSKQLAFNYGNEAVAYINGTSMHIKEAEIESPLTVTGKYSGSTMLQAPIINIGNFSIVVESNGSLSFIANI